MVVAKDGRWTDGTTGAGPVEIQRPMLSSKQFFFQLYLTPPCFMMFSSSSRVGMKLCISIFQCLSFCWKDGRRTDGSFPHGGVEIQPPMPSSKHFIFQLFLTPPSFMMFSSSSRVGMKLYTSVFQQISFRDGRLSPNEIHTVQRTDIGRENAREGK